MTTTAPPALDTERADAFLSTVLEHTSAMTTTVLAAIGARLGLFAELAAHGPSAPADWRAAPASTSATPASGWARWRAPATSITCPPTAGSPCRPSTSRCSPRSAGRTSSAASTRCWWAWSAPSTCWSRPSAAAAACPSRPTAEDTWGGMERFTASWFDHLLLPVWIPAMPRVEAALTRSAEVADVGCGRGRALVALARAFPRSRFVGFDAFAPSVERARRLAEEAGVADRVRFEVRDGSAGLPGRYDVVTTFDVVHDAVDPRGLLRAIRRAVREDGTYVCLDINCSHRLEENAGPLGALLYGFSILYCMTTSLAGAGEGHGTCGFSEAVVRELCAEAGFDCVRLVPLENPFNNLYEITP